MGEQELLDLAGVDVLPAADEHVLDPARDVDVAVGVHGRQVAGVHPPGDVDGFGGRVRLVPVAEHHRVAAGAELPGHPARHRRPRLRIDDLDLDVRVHPAHGRHPALQRVAGPGLGGDRGGLGHAVADRHLGHAHPVDDVLHHLDRARRAGHHPGAQRAQVERGGRALLEHRQLGDEHRRHAQQRRAALLRDRGQGGARLEGGRRVDQAGAARGGAQVADHHAEGVEQRDRHADPVGLGVPAHLADDVGVVEDVVVAQGGALGVAGGARGVLDVDRVVRVGRRLRASPAPWRSPSRSGNACHCAPPIRTTCSSAGHPGAPRRSSAA